MTQMTIRSLLILFQLKRFVLFTISYLHEPFFFVQQVFGEISFFFVSARYVLQYFISVGGHQNGPKVKYFSSC